MSTYLLIKNSWDSDISLLLEYGIIIYTWIYEVNCHIINNVFVSYANERK